MLSSSSSSSSSGEDSGRTQLGTSSFQPESWPLPLPPLPSVPFLSFPSFPSPS